MTRQLLPPLLLLLGLVAVACAGDPEPTQDADGDADAWAVLADTAAALEQITSADAELSLVARGRGDDAAPVGFELDGGFALARQDRSVVADLAYRQLAGPDVGEGRFVSTGEEAFAVVDGVAYTLPPEAADAILGASRGGEGPFEELDIAGWIRVPRLASGDDVDTVTGDVDVVAVYRDLAGFLGLPELSDEEAEQFRAAVAGSEMEVTTGADDRLLRSLRVEVVFGPDTPDDLPMLARGATITFELALSDIGREMTVTAPDDPRPFSELSGS